MPQLFEFFWYKFSLWNPDVFTHMASFLKFFKDVTKWLFEMTFLLYLHFIFPRILEHLIQSLQTSHFQFKKSVCYDIAMVFYILTGRVYCDWVAKYAVYMTHKKFLLHRRHSFTDTDAKCNGLLQKLLDSRRAKTTYHRNRVRWLFHYC